MQNLFRLFISVFLVCILSGCIGETYDFNPPTISLSSDTSIINENLIEANVHWLDVENEIIKKDVEDIFTLVENKHQGVFKAGEKIDLLPNHADFLTEDLEVFVWQNNVKLELLSDLESFYAPETIGDYIVEINLKTDRGSVQYVGNITIK